MHRVGFGGHDFVVCTPSWCRGIAGGMVLHWRQEPLWLYRSRGVFRFCLLWTRGNSRNDLCHIGENSLDGMATRCWGRIACLCLTGD